jgi:Conserved mid region of cactin
MDGYSRPHGRPSNSYHPPSTVPRKRAADAEEDQWVAGEDRFVLDQAKKRAILRVRGGRAQPIDWLAVILRAIDKSDDMLDENEEEGELDIVDPEGVFEGLNREQLETLERDIDTYLAREIAPANQEFWNVRSCSQHLLSSSDLDRP